MCTSNLQIADWLYDGPSVTLSAWPTCVCVRPRDKRRILNCFANSLISSRLTPSTTTPSCELLLIVSSPTHTCNMQTLCFTQRVQYHQWPIPDPNVSLCCFHSVFVFKNFSNMLPSSTLDTLFENITLIKTRSTEDGQH